MLAALTITTHVLAKGGSFVAKVFRGRDLPLLVAQLRLFFEVVTVAKPASSRSNSSECFVVCENFNPKHDYVPTMTSSGSSSSEVGTAKDEEGDRGKKKRTERAIKPFVESGDLSGFD